jgi:WD40 repeat protein
VFRFGIRFHPQQNLPFSARIAIQAQAGLSIASPYHLRQLAESKTWSQPVTHVAFSSFRRSLLALATSSGSVHLFDTLRPSAPLHSFSALHRGALAGLAFSRLNKSLLVTAGESDNRLCMLDVERKSIIGSTDVGSPSGGRLTAMAYADDGRTVALARNDGHVLVVDLKVAAKSPRELKISYPVKGATSIAFQV